MPLTFKSSSVLINFRNTYCMLTRATQYCVCWLYRTDDAPVLKAITIGSESNFQLWELHFSTSKALQNHHFSNASLDFSLQTYHLPTTTLPALNLVFIISKNSTSDHPVQPKYLRIYSWLLPFLHDYQKTFFCF